MQGDSNPERQNANDSFDFSGLLSLFVHHKILLQYVAEKASCLSNSLWCYPGVKTYCQKRFSSEKNRKDHKIVAKTIDRTLGDCEYYPYLGLLSQMATTPIANDKRWLQIQAKNECDFHLCLQRSYIVWLLNGHLNYDLLVTAAAEQRCNFFESQKGKISLAKSLRRKLVQPFSELLLDKLHRSGGEE